MSQRTLEVKKRITEITGAGTHRLQMWVENYQDIDPKVFVHMRKPPTPPAVDDEDVFTNIASAADMVEYPADNPDSELPPFFRTASLDLLFRSVQLMERSVDTIEVDLRALVENLDILDIEGAEDTITIEGEVIP